MTRRLRRNVARVAIGALIVNIAVPLIVALSVAASATASASPFPICSAHAALLGETSPAAPRGNGPADGPTATPLGCPLCPAPLPVAIPTAPAVLPAAWARFVPPPLPVERLLHPIAGPSPVWPHAPPLFS